MSVNHRYTERGRGGVTLVIETTAPWSLTRTWLTWCGQYSGHKSDNPLSCCYSHLYQLCGGNIFLRRVLVEGAFHDHFIKTERDKDRESPSGIWWWWWWWQSEQAVVWEGRGEEVFTWCQGNILCWRGEHMHRWRWQQHHRAPATHHHNSSGRYRADGRAGWAKLSGALTGSGWEIAVFGVTLQPSQPSPASQSELLWTCFQSREGEYNTKLAPAVLTGLLGKLRELNRKLSSTFHTEQRREGGTFNISNLGL